MKYLLPLKNGQSYEVKVFRSQREKRYFFFLLASICCRFIDSFLFHSRKILLFRICFGLRMPTLGNYPPPSHSITEHLERTGLGFRCNVEFRNSGSIKHILRVFKRYSYSENRLNKSLPNHICIGLFPDDVSRFYICSKSQGVHRNLTVQHNSTPHMQQIDLFPTMGATH
jgi:hypothetical protein